MNVTMQPIRVTNPLSGSRRLLQGQRVARSRGPVPRGSPIRALGLNALDTAGSADQIAPIQDLSNHLSVLPADHVASLTYTLAEMTPETAGSIAAVLGPTLSVGTLLFILRIVTTWYPETDGSKLPWLLVYFPTEWILAPSRKVIPPQFGVDVSPIVWVAILSFINEILLGPQGILNLIQRQQINL